MTEPLLPPNTPIAGAEPMQPSWWRWLRQFKDDLAADIAAAGGGGHDPTVLDDGVAVTGQSLVAGSNTIAHGLGRVPIGWFPTNITGAFPASTGQYPNIAPPRSSASFGTASGSSLGLTMQFTPADATTLVALVGYESSSGTSITSLTQTGVSWSKIIGPYDGGASNWHDIWIGTVASGASASVTIAFAGPTTTANTTMTVAEIAEVSSTTPTASDSFRYTTSFPNRHFDTSQQFGTPPVPNAGDVVLTFFHGGFDTSPASAGWQAIAACDATNSAYGDTVMWARVAQESSHQPFLGLVTDSVSSTRAVHQVCLPTSLEAFAVTNGHGLRFVSSDSTNLVLNSLSAVEVDLWVF